jgi:hypothetical protein
MSFMVNDKKWPTPGSVPFLQVIDKYKDEINWDDINTFIECGSGETGDNAIHFSNFFKVHTIENNEALYKRYKDKKGINHDITFILGDGTVELARLCAAHKDERFLILLDDHVGHVSFIEQELNAIRYNSNRCDHVIVVDDTVYFGKGGYPTQEKFESLVKDINPDYICADSEIGAKIQLVYAPIEKEKQS